MQGHTDIGRPSRYEQVGRQPGLRILVAAVGAHGAEQLAFMLGGAREAGMGV